HYSILFFIGVSEAAFLPLRRRQRFDFLPMDAADALHDHLRDALSASNDYRFAAEIDGDQLNLAAIVRIDRPGAIHQRHAFAQREAAPWPNLRLEPLRQSDRDARRNQRAFERFEAQVLVQIGREIHAGGALGHVIGERQVARAVTHPHDLNSNLFHVREKVSRFAAAWAEYRDRELETHTPKELPKSSFFLPMSASSVSAIASGRRVEAASSTTASRVTARMSRITSSSEIARPKKISSLAMSRIHESELSRPRMILPTS